MHAPLMLFAAFASSLSTPSEAARAAAADELRERQPALAQHTACVHRLSILLGAGEAAADALAGDALANSIRTATLEARWRELSDPEAAARELETVLDEALADLTFEPRMEAPLPAGFPGPTPVRGIELKRYPRYRLARAEMGRGGDTGAFWQLFQHIEERDIPMTAPVETTYTERGGRLAERDMAFLYQHAEQGRTGDAGTVEVLDVEPMLVASTGCRGRSSDAAIEAARARLAAWIDERPRLEVAGPLRVLGYNSPMVPTARRYFEVQLPVRELRPARVVVDFTTQAEPARWRSVDDAVMGGVSVSRFACTDDGTSLFTGNVSLENNGGFASVRMDRDDLDLAGARELTLRFRGDGKTYRLRLRTSEGLDVPSYQASFETVAGEWAERSFRIEDFEPTWRGRRVPDMPPLDPAQVRGLGLIISDGQAGSFRLELASLSAR